MVLPLLVLGAGAAAVGSFEAADPETAREERNAGRVMNGRRLNQSVVQAMERELAKKKPEVLVLGNSFANTNVDPKRLAKALGIAPKKVKVLSVPNSIGPHWYAILKNRVFANDHQPKVVIVVSNLQSMLLTEPYSEASYANYAVQLDAEEPLLDGLVPRSPPALDALRQKRGAVRDALLTSVRDASIGLVYPSPNLRRDNERAMDRVFDDALVDMDRYQHALPVSETRGGMPGIDAVPRPEDSILPAIGALAAEHGSTLVFVRTPMAPRTPANELDLVPEGFEAATGAVLDATGHRFVDGSTLPVTDALYVNPGHMTEEGSRWFTGLLADWIVAEGLLDEPAVAWRSAPPTVEHVVGTLPEGLPDDGLDGVWIGGGGRWEATAEAWGAPEAWAFSLVMERFGKGKRVDVRLNGQRLKPEGRPAGGDRVRLRVEDVARPDGPITVSISVPEGVPPVRVQGLAVGKGAARRQWIGRTENHEPAVAELFGEVRLGPDGATLAQPDAVFDGPPPPVPRPLRPVVGTPKRPWSGAIEARDMGILSDAATRELTVDGVRCSPVQVLEDGTPLARPHEACAERPRIPGRVCHGPNGKILFSSSDLGALPRSTRTYTLALDPSRDCMGGRWLYPGDAVSVAVDGVLGRFREGARSLTLTAATANKAAQTVRVEIRDGDTVLLSERWTVPAKKMATRTFVLDRAIWPDMGAVSVELDNPGEGFVLVSSGVLAAGKRP